MTLAQRYQKTAYKKYTTGGSFSSNLDKNSFIEGLVGVLPAVSAMGASLINDGDEQGYRTTGGIIGKRGLTGMSIGSKLGSSFGPVGTAIGGAVGGGYGALSGLLSAGRIHRDWRNERADAQRDELLSQEELSGARMAANPSLRLGNRYREMFKNGGQLKKMDTGGPIDNKTRTDWNNYVVWLEGKGKKGSAELDANQTGYKLIDTYRKENPGTSLTKDSIIPIQNEFKNYRNWAIDQHKAGKMKIAGEPGKDYENFMPDLSIIDGYPGSRTTSHKFPSEYIRSVDEQGKTTTLRQGFATTKMANGGKLANMAHGAVEVKGNSHANGGVDLPHHGAEVEKGETISNGFVFSKHLGFANLHKPIAKAMGKIELKPATAERLNSLKLLKNEEQKLALSQEYLKQVNGIQ